MTPTQGTLTSAEGFIDGLRRANITEIIHLPDSVFSTAVEQIMGDSSFSCYSCSREDEGIAMAAGLYLAGKLSIVLMEGSGVGYSGLILARSLIGRTPMVVGFSHTRGAGERFDYHGATRIVGQGVFEGLNLPYEIVNEPTSISTSIERAALTARGQKTPIGIAFPPYVMQA